MQTVEVTVKRGGGGFPVSPLTINVSASSHKKVKTDSSPLSSSSTGSGSSRRRPALVRLNMCEDEEAEESSSCIITTTIVNKTEEVDRPSLQQGEDERAAGRAGSGEEEAAEEEAQPGRVTLPRLGLKLSGFEEAKEDNEISCITVYAEEAKEERGRPKLTVHSSSSSSSSQHSPRVPLSLPTTSTPSRPLTTQQQLLTLHAEDGVAAAPTADSIIITTTTTTTTTTTSTHMRLLPLTSPSQSNSPSSSSSSAAASTAFVPSKASNMSTTQTTSSRAAKLQYFLADCTKVTDHLFISGQQVACDCALLRRHGITHVVNACGAICDNYFPSEFSYYRLYLQDKGSEDVLGILYDVFAFINHARQQGGKTLIHCQQGVSRSTVLGIGYLMLAPPDDGAVGADGEREWTYADYQTAYSRVRSARGISSPNLGFVCQLLAWSRRLLGRCVLSSSLYRITVHSGSDLRLVNRWMDSLDRSAFDSRFVLLLQSPHAFFIWVGDEVSAEREEAAMAVCRKVVHNLQRYEFGVPRVVKVRRGKEEGKETVTDVSADFGLTQDEWREVEQKREEIRLHAPPDGDDDAEDELQGAEGEGAGGEDGDTDRMRERVNRDHAFDAAAPAEFFYSVLGGRPAWACVNPAFNDDFAAESQQQQEAETGPAAAAAAGGAGVGRRSSRSSLSALSSVSSSRISVVSSVQKMQISPTLSAVNHRLPSAPSLSISPRSRGGSAAALAKEMPPLPANPPRRKASRGEGEGEEGQKR